MTEGDAEADAVLETVLEILEKLATVEELEITEDDEVLDELTTNWYMFKPLGPPQIWEELPAQVILQRPSEIGLDPAWITFPQ